MEEGRGIGSDFIRLSLASGGVGPPAAGGRGGSWEECRERRPEDSLQHLSSPWDVPGMDRRPEEKQMPCSASHRHHRLGLGGAGDREQGGGGGGGGRGRGRGM